MIHQFYAKHSRKIYSKWTLYLTKYDLLFNDCSDQPVSLFEAGIQNGGSLE